MISLVGEGGVHVNSELPSGIIRLPCKKRDEIQCTTAKLNALNTRLESISNDCKIMTLQVWHLSPLVSIFNLLQVTQ